METTETVVENTVVEPVTETTVEPSTAGETVTVTENVKRPRVGREDFMVAWEETVNGLKNGTLTGSGVKIVAERLGLQVPTVQQRATKFRRTYGVALSNMPRSGGAKFNVDKANEELAAIRAKLAEVKTEG